MFRNFDFGGLAYIAGGWRRPPPAGIAYHRNNSIIAVVAIVCVSAVPELFIIELFLGSKPLVWHVVDVFVHVYIVFWSIALFASFRNLPHEFDRDILTIRRGLFDTIRIPLADVRSVSLTPELRPKERRSLAADTAYLGLLDSPMIRISLLNSCSAESAVRKHRPVNTIYLPVDDPETAIAEIQRRSALATRNG